MTVVRFPQERCGGGRAWTERDRSESCVILVLPVVRIDLDDGTAPLLGRRQTRRCRKAINKLTENIT